MLTILEGLFQNQLIYQLGQNNAKWSSAWCFAGLYLYHFFQYSKNSLFHIYTKIYYSVAQDKMVNFWNKKFHKINNNRGTKQFLSMKIYIYFTPSYIKLNQNVAYITSSSLTSYLCIMFFSDNEHSRQMNYGQRFAGGRKRPQVFCFRHNI
jgi:hypothetical protein